MSKNLYMQYIRSYIVYDSTCTLKQTNGNDPYVINTEETHIIGDYYTHSSRYWAITLANYDVTKWIGPTT